MIDAMTKWAVSVSESKKELDKEMFDLLMKTVLIRLERDGYRETFNYLLANYTERQPSQLIGVILLRNHSRQINEKLWSLKRKKDKELEKQARAE